MESINVKYRHLLEQVREEALNIITEAECDEIDGLNLTYSLWIDNALEVPAEDFQEFSEAAFEVVEDICEKNGFEAKEYSDECFLIQRVIVDTAGFMADEWYTRQREKRLAW